MTKQETWEDRFDKDFTREGALIGCGFKQTVPTIKSFISQELKKEYERGFNDGINFERDRIIEIIEEEVFWSEDLETWLVSNKEVLLDKIKG